MMPVALLGKLSPGEMVILVGILMLIANYRLPQVMRNLRDRSGGNGPFSIP
jgi:Sec-independent protein translocase protein TatA